MKSLKIDPLRIGLSCRGALLITYNDKGEFASHDT
jgi:hypothetical protein